MRVLLFLQVRLRKPVGPAWGHIASMGKGWDPELYSYTAPTLRQGRASDLVATFLNRMPFRTDLDNDPASVY